MRFEATRNQMANLTNPYQGRAKKVLCVCSAGLLRSPTLASVLNQELGYNTRACGTASSFALIPISEALIHWADEIVFTDEPCKDYLTPEAHEELKLADAVQITLATPDCYNYNDPELRQKLLEQYISKEV